MIYFIDFDNTICPFGDTTQPPTEACLKTLARIQECLNVICIYSCRANKLLVEDKKQAVEEMLAYLFKHNIPFHHIIHDKPLFNYCIDDRNIGTPLDEYGNVDWSKLHTLVEKQVNPKYW